MRLASRHVVVCVALSMLLTGCRPMKPSDSSSPSSTQPDSLATKLASADQAVKEERMPMGGRLADQSRAEAELASARSSAAKAAAVNAQMTQSNSVLTEELQRASGDHQ